MGWTDVVAGTLGPDQLEPTWRPDNPLVARSGFSASPPQRIDHVFASAGLLETVVARSAAFQFEGASIRAGDGMVTPSDHLGVCVDFVPR